jgi:hypothetical protein
MPLRGFKRIIHARHRDAYRFRAARIAYALSARGGGAPTTALNVRTRLPSLITHYA